MWNHRVSPDAQATVRKKTHGAPNGIAPHPKVEAKIAVHADPVDRAADDSRSQATRPVEYTARVR